MADVISICNAALSHVGDGASVSSIDPPDGSEQANACYRFYPIALASCLDMANWSFATKRTQIAELANGQVELGTWKHAYGLPKNLSHVIDIVPAERFDVMTRKEEFEVVAFNSGIALLADIESPILRYVCSDPVPSKFTGLFTEALSWRLASLLAGEIIRGDSAFSYVQNCEKMFDLRIAQAIAQDAPQTYVRAKHVAPWIRRR